MSTVMGESCKVIFLAYLWIMKSCTSRLSHRFGFVLIQQGSVCDFALPSVYNSITIPSVLLIRLVTRT